MEQINQSLWITLLPVPVIRRRVFLSLCNIELSIRIMRCIHSKINVIRRLTVFLIRHGNAGSTDLNLLRMPSQSIIYPFFYLYGIVIVFFLYLKFKTNIDIIISIIRFDPCSHRIASLVKVRIRCYLLRNVLTQLIQQDLPFLTKRVILVTQFYCFVKLYKLRL